MPYRSIFKQNYYYYYFVSLKASFSIESNIDVTAAYVLDQVAERSAEIISILIECASKLPEKQSIYSTLIGLLNLRNPNFVEEVI